MEYAKKSPPIPEYEERGRGVRRNGRMERKRPFQISWKGGVVWYYLLLKRNDKLKLFDGHRVGLRLFHLSAFWNWTSGANADERLNLQEFWPG